MNDVAVRITRLKPGSLLAFKKKREQARPSWPAADFSAMVDIGPQYTMVEGFRTGADGNVSLNGEIESYVSSMLVQNLKPATFSPKIPWDVVGGCVDFRFYKTEPGKLEGFLDLYEKQGFPIQREVLGTCCGFFYDQEKSTVVHFWWFSSPNDRAARRIEVQKVPEWQAYLAEAAPYLRDMNNWLLSPTL